MRMGDNRIRVKIHDLKLLHTCNELWWSMNQLVLMGLPSEFKILQGDIILQWTYKWLGMMFFPKCHTMEKPVMLLKEPYIYMVVNYPFLPGYRNYCSKCLTIMSFTYFFAFVGRACICLHVNWLYPLALYLHLTKFID